MGLKEFEKLLRPVAGTLEALYKCWLNKIRNASLYDSFGKVKMHGRKDFSKELFIF
jgi:hypothetical protein